MWTENQTVLKCKHARKIKRYPVRYVIKITFINEQMIPHAITIQQDLAQAWTTKLPNNNLNGTGF